MVGYQFNLFKLKKTYGRKHDIDLSLFEMKLKKALINRKYEYYKVITNSLNRNNDKKEDFQGGSIH